MNTPTETIAPQPPEVLDLALSQIAEVLKDSGKEKLAALANTKDGYAQIIWLLEKVSKASLDWREHERAKDERAEGKPGISFGTEKQIESILER